jgi:hypothetical protein
MSSLLCSLCDTVITNENDTKEHIIPNAIGGRKKVRGFICKQCNNSTGHTWDNELAQQLSSMSLYFGILRERGDVQSKVFETTTGEKIQLNPDGTLSIDKPKITIQESPKGAQFQISARTVKEAKMMRDGYLKKINKKYPDAIIEGFHEGMTFSKKYPNGSMQFSDDFGGNLAGRSIVKTAVSYAVSIGISAQKCTNALQYLRDENALACWGYYYATDLVINRPEDQLLHCIGISGDPDEKLLLAYVEYFGFRRMIVCLDRNYSGDEIHSAYAINPITGKEVDVAINFDFRSDDLELIYDYKMIPPNSIEEATAKALYIGHRRHQGLEQNRIFDQVLNRVCMEFDLGPDDPIDETMYDVFINKIIEELLPWIVHKNGLQVPDDAIRDLMKSFGGIQPKE